VIRSRIYELAIGTNIGDLEMALILHYFTEFGSVRAHCLKVVDKAITIGNLRSLSTSKRLQRDRATPTA